MAVAAVVHAPFGLNYRHALNRGEAARERRDTPAQEKNGNEAAAWHWQPSPPRWLSARTVGPDTGMKFSSKNARLKEKEGDGQNRYHADHCGNPRPSGRRPRWTSLHWIKALSTGRRRWSGVVVASCHQNHPSTEESTLKGKTANLCECNFQFCCILDNPPACMQTAKAAAQQLLEVMLAQQRLTVFKYEEEGQREK